jgi:hypothetical protein
MADSVFGDLGGSGKQSAGAPVPGPDPYGAHNALGQPTSNPSGNHGPVPPQGSVFGDLGGGGVACQTGGPVIPEPGSGDSPTY